MRLFKFVASTTAVLNMAKGTLKFTPIEELNDPSELTPVMNRPAVRASLASLRKNGLTQDQFKWLQRQEALLDLLSPEEKILSAPRTLSEANRILSIGAYDNLDYMERKLFATIKNIRARVGIFSLSLRYDSLPMWAHYADLARGFVVVFEDLEKAFSGDETGSLKIPKPVVYSNEFTGMTFDPSTQDSLFFSKLSDWSYEREWRVVSALSACRQSPGDTLHLRHVDPVHLTAVISGWRVSTDNRSLLSDSVKRLNPAVELISANLDRGKVNLSPRLP